MDKLVDILLTSDEQQHGFTPQRIEGPTADAALAYFEEMVFRDLDIKPDNERAWIAGGCLRHWLQHKRIAKGCDIDLWTADKDEANRLNSLAKDKGWTKKKETSTSFNWQSKSGHWVQIIRNYHFDSAVRTIQEFDFTVCAFALSCRQGFLCHPSALIDMAMNCLQVIQLQFPRSTLLRTYKYRDKGYKICAGELEKIVQALAELVEVEKAAAAMGEEVEKQIDLSKYPWVGLD